MQDFRGRVAVVTGAASGIGLACARMFARQGMNVESRHRAIMAAYDTLVTSR